MNECCSEVRDESIKDLIISQEKTLKELSKIMSEISYNIGSEVPEPVNDANVQNMFDAVRYNNEILNECMVIAVRMRGKLG